MPPAASNPGLCKRCCLICLPLLLLCCQTVTALAQQPLHTILCKQAEPESCNISLREHKYVWYARSQLAPHAVCNTQPCGSVGVKIHLPHDSPSSQLQAGHRLSSGELSCMVTYGTWCPARVLRCHLQARYGSAHFAIAAVTGGLRDITKTSTAYHTWLLILPSLLPGSLQRKCHMQHNLSKRLFLHATGRPIQGVEQGKYHCWCTCIQLRQPLQISIDLRGCLVHSPTLHN